MLLYRDFTAAFASPFYNKLLSYILIDVDKFKIYVCAILRPLAEVLGEVSFHKAGCALHYAFPCRVRSE